MTKKERALQCVDLLKQEYPNPECSLVASDPYQLLVATRLSAQCTDARVNIVTPDLFAKYPTPEAMSKADVEDVEELIRSTGFYHTKARDLVIMAQQILDVYHGAIPDSVEELTKLQGVGRKTANLICGDIYHIPGSVVTDTHLIRIANRIGLVETKDPKKVELELRQLLPPEESNNFCHRCVMHGRACCTARTAHCEACILTDVCKKKI